MLAKKVHFDKNGRIAIPAKMRKQLNINLSSEALIKCDGNSIVITSFEKGLENARSILEKYKVGSLLDELYKMRKHDASKE
jgi:bifunctional DNA-binding transcriptional regulator/antitoxin component of YhaV-PrlF toxin-antitoxin module